MIVCIDCGSSDGRGRYTGTCLECRGDSFIDIYEWEHKSDIWIDDDWNLYDGSMKLIGTDLGKKE